MTNFELVNMFGEFGSKYHICNNSLSCSMGTYGFIENTYEFRGIEFEVTLEDYDMDNFDGDEVDYVEILNDKAVKLILNHLGKLAAVGL